MTGRIVVEDVTPLVGGGQHPTKAVVGERIPVGATVWWEGHATVGATLVLRRPGARKPEWVRMRSVNPGLDRYEAVVVPDEPGMWTIRVDAWGDPWSTWLHGVRAKVTDGAYASELSNDFELGARLLERVAYRPDRRDDRDVLCDAAAQLRSGDLVPRERADLAPRVMDIMEEHPIRTPLVQGRTYQIRVDRQRALFGSWYELFPRSTGGTDEAGNPVHGTFTTAQHELDRIAAMGFDVVYLPPIHPIGKINRKGRNNCPHAGKADVGSPWGIGSDEGGHDAIHPDLGTIDDFDAFRARAGELGLEVAIDLALQCAPDHPWVRQHPEWFTTLPDGSIATAENPPKKYEDIYALNFDEGGEALSAEILRVVLHWVEHGVRIFRVDNPHTKPPAFWEWLIGEVKAVAPDVLFLSEAFTRPARLYGLARLGFTQNYTYFTWRVSKEELTEFGRELVAHADESRPNLFVNTPDILPKHLHAAPAPMFALRAALAATLSPTWGVYAGFELLENVPLDPAGEDYLDSEKYQLRPRDPETALVEGRSLQPWITRLNEIRRAHPALQGLRSLVFHDVDNQQLIAYSKTDSESGDVVLCVVTLDPAAAQEGTVNWDLAAIGMQGGATFTVVDEVGGEIFEWGECCYVKLDPSRAVAHVASVVRR